MGMALGVFLQQVIMAILYSMIQIKYDIHFLTAPWLLIDCFLLFHNIGCTVFCNLDWEIVLPTPRMEY